MFLDCVLRYFFVVNLKDKILYIEKFFLGLCFLKLVIDYYLFIVVFLKDMREFLFKFLSFGWDFVKLKVYVVMGFSGIMDLKYVFFLFIIVLDFLE